MIKESEKEKDVAIYQAAPSYKKEKYVVYECSDGKEFTNENDNKNGYLTGKEQAERYEDNLRLENIAKAELRFYSISNDKHDNNGYEHSFCFYYHPGLSSESKNKLYALIFNLKSGKDMEKMTDGWYLVQQSVYEVESSSRCGAYECSGYFGLLESFVEGKERSFNYYKSILDTVKS